MMKVSIIIPIYNAEKTLERCLTKISEQTYADIEIILVNDCSTDESERICKEMISRDPRARYLKTDANRGAGLARNTGLDNATGHWVTFCDSDDYPESSWISDFVDGISGGCDMVVQGFYCDNWPTAVDGRVVTFVGEGYRDHVAAALCRDAVFGFLWCKMYRMDIIRQHQLRFKDIVKGEDELFNIRYFKYISQISCVDKANYHYYCPDFYSKYGSKDGFDDSIELFRAAEDTFGKGSFILKDIMTERCSDWLLASVKAKDAATAAKTRQFCDTVLPYLPKAKYCRRTTKMVGHCVFPYSIGLSVMLLRVLLYVLKK